MALWTSCRSKVESAIHYIKDNFFRGRQGAPMDEVERELARWVNEIAGRREHGTTGRRPREAFKQHERAALRPLPELPFEPVVWKRATVHRDCHVVFEKRLYSVPWCLLGQVVWLRATASSVTIYADEERVATHPRLYIWQRL